LCLESSNLKQTTISKYRAQSAACIAAVTCATYGPRAGSATICVWIRKRLVTENTVGKWNKNDFMAMQYPLPKQGIKGKTKITVRFVPHPGHTAGGIFDLRIIQID